MTTESKVRTLSARTTAQFHASVKARAAQEGSDIQGFVLSAVLDRMGSKDLSKSDDIQPAARAGAPSEKEQKWLDRLLLILRSGNKQAISAVTQNIAVFLDYIQQKDNNPKT